MSSTRLQTPSPSPVSWWRPYPHSVIYYSDFSVILLSLFSLRSSLGLSFAIHWCFYTPLLLILSKPESNYMYFRCLHTIQEPQRCKLHHVHLYSMTICISLACCLLCLASFHSECLLAFTSCSVTPCANYLQLAVPKARIHPQQWQSTEFIILYNQSYAK